MGEIHGGHHTHASAGDVVELPDLGISEGDGFIFGDRFHLEGSAIDAPVHLEHLEVYLKRRGLVGC